MKLFAQRKLYLNRSNTCLYQKKEKSFCDPDIKIMHSNISVYKCDVHVK